MAVTYQAAAGAACAPEPGISGECRHRSQGDQRRRSVPRPLTRPPCCTRATEHGRGAADGQPRSAWSSLTRLMRDPWLSGPPEVPGTPPVAPGRAAVTAFPPRPCWARREYREAVSARAWTVRLTRAARERPRVARAVAHPCRCPRRRGRGGARGAPKRAPSNPPSGAAGRTTTTGSFPTHRKAGGDWPRQRRCGAGARP